MTLKQTYLGYFMFCFLLHGLHAEALNSMRTPVSAVEWSVDAMPLLNGTIEGLGNYTDGSVATFTAVPNSGYIFAGWSGSLSGATNPVSVTVDDNKTVGADFVSEENYNRIVQAGYAEGETAGIIFGEAAVIADPLDYDLYSIESINTLSNLGGIHIGDGEGTKWVSFNFESSGDLQVWTVEERIERQLAMPSNGRLFMRVAIPEADVVTLIDIPSGSFEMGDSFSEGGSRELPVHTVFLSAYMVGETEVTFAQWLLVRDWAVNNGYSDLEGVGVGKGADHPVHSVNWYDVVKWCNAASERAGLEPVYYESPGGEVYRTGNIEPSVDLSRNGYRLPTEAEWENAARGGMSGSRFPWGDTISHEYANYVANGSAYTFDATSYISDTYHPDFDDTGVPNTSPVKTFSPNGYGLYGAADNLREWCNDWFQGDYGSTDTQFDPLGPETGTRRLVRGGGYNRDADGCRVSVRTDVMEPSNRYNDFGFRIARRR